MKRFFFMPFLLFALFTLSAASSPPQLSQWLRDLDNADPGVREEAKENLMTLHRSDLDALRQIVAHSPALSPEQVVSLHEIVTQVILAEAQALGSPNGHGFLGAQPLECQIPAADGKSRPAILIAHLVAGFDAYRMLRTGDIILSIDGNAQTTQNLPSFMTAILSHIPGEHLHLQLLRGGKNLEVTVELFARPETADNMGALDVTDNPEDRVKPYWDATFEPIILRKNAD